MATTCLVKMSVSVVSGLIADSDLRSQQPISRRPVCAERWPVPRRDSLPGHCDNTRLRQNRNPAFSAFQDGGIFDQVGRSPEIPVSETGPVYRTIYYYSCYIVCACYLFRHPDVAVKYQTHDCCNLLANPAIILTMQYADHFDEPAHVSAAVTDQRDAGLVSQ
jgi:hypothetical protein